VTLAHVTSMQQKPVTSDRAGKRTRQLSASQKAKLISQFRKRD